MVDLCCCLGFSPVAVEATLQLQCVDSSLRGFSCLGAQAPGREGFCSCSTWPQKLQLLVSRAQAQWLWHTDLVAPRHVGSSQTRDQTHVSYVSHIVRWAHYLWRHLGSPKYGSNSGLLVFLLETL